MNLESVRQTLEQTATSVRQQEERRYAPLCFTPTVSDYQPPLLKNRLYYYLNKVFGDG